MRLVSPIEVWTSPSSGVISSTCCRAQASPRGFSTVRFTVMTWSRGWSTRTSGSPPITLWRFQNPYSFTSAA